jgi:hypothetical protein
MVTGERHPQVRRLSEGLDQSEVQDLDEVHVLAVAAEEDIRGFDVAMDKSAGFGLAETLPADSCRVRGPRLRPDPIGRRRGPLRTPRSPRHRT